MSAFMISTETMQRVVDAIDRDGMGMSWFGIPIGSSKRLDVLGRKLFRLNAAALKARYPGEPHVPPTFNYRPLGAVAAHEHFQALSCLLYQCGEGDVYKTEIYKALDELRTRIALRIAADAARAADTPWDF